MTKAERDSLDEPVFFPKNHLGSNKGARILSFTMAALFSLSILFSGIYNSAFAQRNAQNDMNLFKSINAIEQPYVKKDDLEGTLYELRTDGNGVVPLKTDGGLKDAPLDFIVVTGHVGGSPQPFAPANLPADVYAKDITTGDTLLHTVADVQGNYSLVFAWTGTRDQIAIPDESGIVLGNPTTDKARIRFSSPDTEEYNILVTDLQGNKIINQYKKLQVGINDIEIDGLSPKQLNIITLISNDKTNSFKIVNNSDNQTTPAVNINHVNDNPTVTYKSTSSLSLNMMFRENGFYDKDIIVQNVSGTVNATMEKIPDHIIHTTIKPYDVNGNPANITITAQWSDSLLAYPTVNGEIHIDKNLYTSSANATLQLDSVTYVNNQNYLALMMGRKIQQPREENNLFQSPKEWGQQFPQPVTVDMSNPNINGQVIYDYVVKKMVKNPNNGTGWGQVPGDSIRMDHPYIVRMINRNDGVAVGTEKYIDVPNIPQVNPFYILVATFDMKLNGGYPQLPQWQIDRLHDYLAKVEAMGIIPYTNDTIFTQKTVQDITSFSAPTYVTCLNRQDQYILIGYNSASTPHNSVAYSTQNIPSNTMKRASRGNSENGPSDVDAMIHAEILKVDAVLGDPNVGSASPWIWDSATSDATTLGLTMVHIAGLSKLNYKY